MYLCALRSAVQPSQDPGQDLLGTRTLAFGQALRGAFGTKARLELLCERLVQRPARRQQGYRDDHGSGTVTGERRLVIQAGREQDLGGCVQAAGHPRLGVLPSMSLNRKVMTPWGRGRAWHGAPARSVTMASLS